jgi:hypothetical protein
MENFKSFIESKMGNPFQNTLSLIQSKLNSNLPEGIKKIWVEGNQKGSVTLCLTIFPIIGQYRFEFHSMKNFRNIKIDMDENLTNEIINGYVNDILKLIK